MSTKSTLRAMANNYKNGHCWDALDPQLRNVVNCMIRTSEEAVRSIAQVRIRKLNSEIDRLQARTIWDMIRSKFKREKK